MGDENNTNNQEQNNGNNGNNTPKYDIADVVKELGLDAILADPTISAEVTSRRDRHTTQALQTARTKWDAEQARKQAEEADEATRLAHMSEAEKAKYTLDKERAEFEKQKAEFNRKSLVLETARQMTEAGLPDLADYVTGKDADETAQNIQKVTSILGAWKTQQLTNAMRGQTPPDMTPGKKYTQADLKTMTPAEINKAFEAGLIEGVNK